MFCQHCGANLPDNAKFCTGCGAPMAQASRASVIKTVKLECKGCGCVLDADPENPILICPACGSKELIAEDKDVAIERLRTRTKREEQQIYRDVEMGRQQLQHAELQRKAAQDQYEREKDSVKTFKHSGIRVFSIIFTVIFILCTAISFSSGAVLAGVISLVQVALFVLSWLLGEQVIKTKNDKLYLIPAIISFVLIAAFLMTL